MLCLNEYPFIMHHQNLNDIVILDDKRMLGEGAFSFVYKARSRLDGRLYALKKVASSDRQDPTDPARHTKLA